MGDTAVDIFLETLKELITSSKLSLINEEKHQLRSLEEEIKYLRGFLKDTEKKRDNHPEVMKLVMQIRDLISEAENIVELFVVHAYKEDHAPPYSLHEDRLESFKRRMKTLKEKHELQYLEEEIKYLRGFLKDTEKKRDNHPEVMKLVMLQIRDLISEAENIVQLFVVHAYKEDHAPYSLHEGRLEIFKRRMKTLKAEVWIQEMSCLENETKAISAGVDHHISVDHSSAPTLEWRWRTGLRFTQQTQDFQWGHTSEMVKGKVEVGFKEEVVQKLIEKLDGGEGKPLEIISIIGSSRGGKTTLAREVYNHPYTSHVFKICAWINVSQNYDKTMKRDLLIRILESAIPKKHKDYKRYSDDKLGAEIFKYLKGRKYLIVMDDMWGIEAWNDIQKSFPKEYKGSKVLFTTRLRVQLDSVSYIPHYLAPLPNWCWELLQKKDTLDWLISHLYNRWTFGLNVEEKHDELRSLRYDKWYLRRILEHIKEYSNDSPEVTRLVMQITDLVAEAENIGELFVVHAFKADDVPYYLLEPQDHLSLDLETIKKGMKTLIAEVKKIYDESMYDNINGVATKLLKHSSTENGENVVVGFDEEVKRLIEKLDDGGQGRSLEIISLIGAGGGGKTTLAKKLYHDPFVKYIFDIRAWIDVSHDYHKAKKRDSLISILESISPENYENNSGSSDDKLGEDNDDKFFSSDDKLGEDNDDKLGEDSDDKFFSSDDKLGEDSDDKLGEDILKLLKGKKYLIVMDDIWGIEAWNDIERSFPKESKGSKVLFTSRHLIPLDGIPWVPYYLEPLPRNRCWELLHKKVFGMEGLGCPLELVKIGEEIAEKCKGLPLAIVTIAGILATQDKTIDAWENVSKNLSSIFAKNQEDFMGILELSYNHLPLHLKACFLYIGGYPEDSEIPIRELIWLWIAEGFIQQSKGEESLETIAEGYLIDLIHRSLVQVARKSPLGGIKACHIHDLLRELCLKKAKDDNFLVNFYEDGYFSPSAANKHRRLFIGHEVEKDSSFFVQNFVHLRVLNFLSGSCSGEIGRGHLVHLRYLAYKSHEIRELPFSYVICGLPFSYLLNLETLNLKSIEKVIELPYDIFKMVKLRHLYTKNGVFNFHRSRREEESIGFDRSSKLDSLQTLHQICACEHCRSFLVRTPNLKKLGLHKGQKITGNNLMRFPELECLKCLEKLTFTFQFKYPFVESTLPPGLKLPPTITRITLKKTCLKWEELSLLQTLPSLEVLKLMESACSGPVWNTSELDGFPQLKYLRFYHLDIMEWIAFEDQFSKLEVLVLERCYKLECIPKDFGYLNDLREIKLERCRSSAEQSAKEIQEEQINRKGEEDCLNLLAINNSFY